MKGEGWQPVAFQLGTILGGYEFIDVLERSKQRVTYRVRNLATGALEQLQVLPEVLQKDPVRAERFMRELRILASLSHPNILNCHAVVELQGDWAMTLELPEGVTLAERLELGPLALPEAVAVMQQVLSAVAFVHERGVVHREITPASVLISPDRTVKLTGFTYAKTAEDLGLTQVGTIVGDVEYMAPEQVRGMNGVDARSDVYSLGALFYALLTGRPPFQAQSQFDVMMAQVNQEPVPPSQVNPSLPAVLDQLVLGALAKRPESRYQSAAEFLTRLEMAALTLQIGARKPPRPASAPQPTAASIPMAAPTVPPWGVAALAALLVLIFGAVMFALLRWVS